MRRGVLAMVAILICAAASASMAAEPAAAPGPAQGPMPEGRAARNAACEGCHADIAREWRASMHRRSFTDAPYQRALAREPVPFCRGCHAPEADPAAPPPAAAADIGVGCVTCHTPPGAKGILAGVERAGAGSPAHQVVRDPAFSAEDACASCHQFRFPDVRGRIRDEWMQSTITEHARSPHASTPCASCHMPWKGQGQGRHRSHAFALTRDPAALARALSVRVAREGAGVRFSLAPQGVGHAMPTGDLFRRIALVVETPGAEGTRRTRSVDYLGRRFGLVPQRKGVYTLGCIEDDRLEGPTDVLLPVPAGAGSSLRWRVVYQRIEHPTSNDESTAVSGGDVVLAEGVLDGP